MKNWLRALAGPLLVLAMLIGSLWLLHNELKQYHLRDLPQGVAGIPAAGNRTSADFSPLSFAGQIDLALALAVEQRNTNLR